MRRPHVQVVEIVGRRWHRPIHEIQWIADHLQAEL